MVAEQRDGQQSARALVTWEVRKVLELRSCFAAQTRRNATYCE